MKSSISRSAAWLIRPDETMVLCRAAVNVTARKSIFMSQSARLDSRPMSSSA
jgi:hypothetical protein